MRCRVKSNQESPLLRLPPEIRNKIWEYTLGHNILKPIRVRLGWRSYKHRWISRRNESQINLSLLATCRQIYSEGALMPFVFNTFATETWYRDQVNLARSFTMFKVHQRMLITSILLRYCSYASLEWDDRDEIHLRNCGSQLGRWLPNLNTIEFAVASARFADSLRSTATIAHIKAALHRGISTHNRVDVKVNSQVSADTWLP